MNDGDDGETKIIFGRDNINDIFVKSVSETADNWKKSTILLSVIHFFLHLLRVLSH